jgi:hypothetical protein
MSTDRGVSFDDYVKEDEKTVLCLTNVPFYEMSLQTDV